MKNAKRFLNEEIKAGRLSVDAMVALNNAAQQKPPTKKQLKAGLKFGLLSLSGKNLDITQKAVELIQNLMTLDKSN